MIPHSYTYNPGVGKHSPIQFWIHSQWPPWSRMVVISPSTLSECQVLFLLFSASWTKSVAENVYQKYTLGVQQRADAEALERVWQYQKFQKNCWQPRPSSSLLPFLARDRRINSPNSSIVRQYETSWQNPLTKDQSINVKFSQRMERHAERWVEKETTR